jgi:hypothetical protein
MNVSAFKAGYRQHIRSGQLFPIPFSAIDIKRLPVAKLGVDAPDNCGT